jgi:hypothetical protein
LVEKFFPVGSSAGQSELVVHIDNVLASNSKMTQDVFGRNPLNRVRRLPYSSDISPSDFYLFEKAKSVLVGQEIPDEIDLLEAVSGILKVISDGELQRVFRSWIERVERVTGAGGD